MGSPFDFEIKARKAGNYPVKKSPLPWLNSWQYGKALYSDDDFYGMVNAYRSWVYVASSKNATTVANIPLRLYVAKNNKGNLKGYPTKSVSIKQEKNIRESSSLSSLSSVRKAVQFEEILDHPFLDLKRNVNGFMNNFDLFEMTQLYQELTGNSYWQILSDKFGVPREIWTIPPQNCKIIPDREKFISGYKYIKGQEEIDLVESEVIHFKMPNPKSMYYGFAPFSSISESYGLGRSIDDYEMAMFNNQGTLSGLFETDEQLGDHEFERLKEEIRQSFTGARNTGKMPLLDSGLKFKPMGTSPKEMSYLGGRDHLKEIVLNAYGLSLGMFSKDANRANIDGATYLYMSSTIKPRLQRLQEKLNEKLMPRYDDKLFVAFDNPVPEDRAESLNEQIKYVNWGIDSIDEVRIARGKKPFGGAFSEPILPVNMTTMDGILANIANGSGNGNIVNDPNKMKELLNNV
ncbi:MAG: phage portal protein [Candidatus Doudnabacteria bacterium]